MEKTFLTIVVPCYKEEAVILDTNKMLTSLMERLVEKSFIHHSSKILYIDDGSTDKTWSIIKQLSEESEYVSGAKLSRNFGHQGALLAGIEIALKESDCIVSIDADLQDDPEAIIEFIQKFDKGYDVVYGVRKKRDTDTVFKRNSARMFYKLMNLFGVELVPDHADFRLLSKQAAKHLLSFRESAIFIRGIVPLIGFSSTEVYYNRKPRLAGESKYPLKKMLSFSVEGLTSFSIAPIKFIFSTGIFSLLIAVFISGYSIFRKLSGEVISGWTSLMVSIWFLGGLLLISVSILGLYVGKIFLEVKHRPRYIIETVLKKNVDKKS